MKLPQNLAEIDSYLYHRLRSRFTSLMAAAAGDATINGSSAANPQQSQSVVVNHTLVVDAGENADGVRNLEIPVSAQLVWPRLLSHSVVHFPLTAVGNFTIVNLTLANPTTLPVVVQLLPLVIYPDAETLIEFFRDELLAPLTEPVEMNETLMFSLRDTELFTLRPGSPVPAMREEVERAIGGPVPR